MKIKPKVKHLKLKTEKAKAWKAFSLYIRTRDKDQGCISCGRTYPIQQMQAGHFLGGRHNSILFDEKGTNAQCYGCNIGKKGNFMAYYHALVDRYGEEFIPAIEEQDKQIVKYTAADYQELTRFYKEKTKELK